jgi:hypothetical protein
MSGIHSHPYKPGSSFMLAGLALFLAVLACSAPVQVTSTVTPPGINKTELALQTREAALKRTEQALKNTQKSPAASATPSLTVTQQASLTPTATTEPPPSPTVTTQPPTATSTTAPTATLVPTAADQPLILGLTYSTKTFYCYQTPTSLVITVKVSDINRGMAVYYRLKDKVDGRQTDWEIIDLHRLGSDVSRSATIVGGWDGQNLHFPALMHESWFVFQIISDDGAFRGPFYSDVTFFPCAQ